MSVIEQVDAVKDDVKLVCLLDIPAEDGEPIIESVDNLDIVSNTMEFDDAPETHAVDIPGVFESLDSRIRFVLEVMREREVVDVGDEVAVVAQLPSIESPVVGTVSVLDEFINDDIRTLFFESQPSIDTIQKALDVAISLSQTGHKGDPVGALFVIGDEEVVMDRSRPLNHNPFSGADVFLGDDISVSIGEFAKLDGAFVISGNGRVVSASRYLEPRVHNAEVPSGLGARHMAASGITKATDAVSIVVSESDQKVRCFVDGELIVSADPTDIESIQ